MHCTMKSFSRSHHPGKSLDTAVHDIQMRSPTRAEALNRNALPSLTFGLAVVLSALRFSCVEAQDSLAEGLVAYYHFDGNGSDASLFHNDAYRNEGLVAAGHLGDPNTAIHIGGGQTIRVSNSSSLSSFGNFVTISTWLAPETLQPRYTYAVKKGVYQQNGTFAVVVDGQTMRPEVWFGLAGGSQVQAKGPEIIEGAWTHVVGVFDGTTASLYLNGALVAATTSAGALENNTSDLTFGLDPENQTVNFNGKVDETRIYNRALSASEVRALYRLEAQLYLTDGLVAYYHFDGNGTDASGYHNDAYRLEGTSAAGLLGATATAVSVDNGQTIRVANSASLSSFQNAASVSAWLRPGSLPPRYSYAMKKGVYLQNGSFVVVINGVTMRPEVWFGLADGELVQVPGPAIPTESWTHVMGVFDGTKAALYLNGTLVGTTIASGVLENNSSDLTFGLDPDNSSVYFSGRLDEARVYNRALSPDEVRDLYRYEAPELPRVSVEVESVRVTMHISPMRRYQLQGSMNLSTWANIGDPFVAVSSEVTKSINTIESAKFFRLLKVP